MSAPSPRVTGQSLTADLTGTCPWEAGLHGRARWHSMSENWGGNSGTQDEEKGGRYENRTHCGAETGSGAQAFWVPMWLGSDTCCVFDLG